MLTATLRNDAGQFQFSTVRPRQMKVLNRQQMNAEGSLTGLKSDGRKASCRMR